MQAKEYLQQLQRLDTVINQKIKEVQDLRLKSQSIGSIDYSKEQMQKSPSKDPPFVKLTNRIIDLEAEINTEIDKYVDEEHTIINQIQSLKNANYVSVLFKRYVEFKKFEIISVEMNFTYQYIIEMHGYALREFETTYENILKHI